MPEDRLRAGVDAGRQALHRFLVGEDDLDTMLRRIAEIATESVPRCDLTTITLVRGGQPVTAACTDRAALELDDAQYAAGDGPCLAAIAHQGVERWNAGDDRWPDFGAAARRLGVTSVLATPLVDGEHAVGALNLYSCAAAGYDERAREVAALYADQLGIAAARAVRLVEGHELALHLQAAMRSRATIEQAKGILMAAEGCTPDEAFGILRAASQHRNVKLRVIASDIVERYTRGP